MIAPYTKHVLSHVVRYLTTYEDIRTFRSVNKAFQSLVDSKEFWNDKQWPLHCRVLINRLFSVHPMSTTSEITEFISNKKWFSSRKKTKKVSKPSVWVEAMSLLLHEERYFKYFVTPAMHKKMLSKGHLDSIDRYTTYRPKILNKLKKLLDDVGGGYLFLLHTNFLAINNLYENVAEGRLNPNLHKSPKIVDLMRDILYFPCIRVSIMRSTNGDYIPLMVPSLTTRYRRLDGLLPETRGSPFKVEFRFIKSGTSMSCGVTDILYTLYTLMYVEADGLIDVIWSGNVNKSKDVYNVFTYKKLPGGWMNE